MPTTTNEDLPVIGGDLRVNVYWQRIRSECDLRGWTTTKAVQDNRSQLFRYLDTAIDPPTMYHRAQRILAFAVAARTSQRIKTDTERGAKVQLEEAINKYSQGIEGLEFELAHRPAEEITPPPLNWKQIEDELQVYLFKHPILYANTDAYVSKRLIRLKGSNKSKMLPAKHFDFRRFGMLIRSVSRIPLDGWEISTIITEEMEDQFRLDKVAQNK